MHEQLFTDLGKRFEKAGHELFLVGGSVRDIALGREPKDWDFTTTATPEEIKAVVGRPSQRGWADAVWTVGERFGTIALRKDGVEIEITTMRCDGPGRKPEVTWTTDLTEDLARRDFTINAMALRCDSDGLATESSEFIDPFNGRTDLFLELIKTPIEPWKTFSEDPLRMLRAARFASQLGFTVGNTEEMAMSSNRDLISTVSAERVAAELDKLIMGKDPRRGLWVLRWTGLLDIVADELSHTQVLSFSIADLDVRWASAFGGKGGMHVERLFKALKMSNERTRTVSKLATMAVEFDPEDADWDDKPTVRRILADAAMAAPNDARGFLKKFVNLVTMTHDIHNLARTLNVVLAEEGFPKPALSGKEIMDHLQIGPGKDVGNASGFLWGKTLDEGPMTKDRARAVLDEWKEWSAR